MRRTLLVLLVIAVSATLWGVVALSRSKKSTPKDDAEFLRAASSIEVVRTPGTLQPMYRLALTPGERDALVGWIKRRTDDGGQDGLQKHVLMPKHLGLVVDGKRMSGFSPGWRGEEAIAHVLPEIPAAADAFLAAEGLDWWRSRFDRPAEPERESQLANVCARLRGVLTEAEVARMRSESLGGDLEFAEAVAALIRTGDGALRWSPDHRAFVRGKADRPLFSRFRKDP